MENRNDIEKLFGYSLKNKFEVSNNYNSDIEYKALEYAQILNDYLKTNQFEKEASRQIIIQTKDKILLFNSTTVKFKKENGDECKIDVSVPISFDGEIRLWTINLKGQKIWSTNARIYESHCSPKLLFDFLGKYLDRFTPEEADNLPF